MVKLLSALDQFLFDLVLLYFAYSICFLFFAREIEEPERTRIRMPDWLKVQSLGEMKKTLLEVIVVLLAVLFLKFGLELAAADLNWELLVIPIGIVAIAGAVKLLGLDH